jgi:hypothetical protein
LVQSETSFTVSLQVMKATLNQGALERMRASKLVRLPMLVAPLH